MLLVIDNDPRICQYFPMEVHYLDASDLSLFDVLSKLRAYSNVEQIYIPAELRLKDCLRRDRKGLDLFKHIRLTAELLELAFVPVLMGYTFPLEIILRSSESAMFCAPGLQLFNLSNIGHIAEVLSITPPKRISRELLKPYVLFDDQDDGKSDHDRRNEDGPAKLANELTQKPGGRIDAELWQKKIQFLQADSGNPGASAFSAAEFDKSVKGKNILYLDDEAERWTGVLKEAFAGATLSVKSDYQTIASYLNDLQEKQERLRTEYEETDRDLWSIYLKQGDSTEFRSKRIAVHQFKNRLSTLLNYDLVLVDMRLDKPTDRNKALADVSGLQVVEQLQRINPFIPVMMFTASNRIESYREAAYSGAYDFWIKNVSTGTDLKRKALNLMRNELADYKISNLKNLYAEYLMIKSRAGIYNYFYNASGSLDSAPFSGVDRERINQAVLYFVNFIQRCTAGNITDTDIEELWKLTSVSIEIRVPVISGRLKRDIEKIDHGHKISPKEFRFRSYRNYFSHGQLKIREGSDLQNPYDFDMALDYIYHTINFLMDYR